MLGLILIRKVIKKEPLAAYKVVGQNMVVWLSSFKSWGEFVIPGQFLKSNDCCHIVGRLNGYRDFGYNSWLMNSFPLCPTWGKSYDYVVYGYATKWFLELDWMYDWFKYCDVHGSMLKFGCRKFYGL